MNKLAVLILILITMIFADPLKFKTLEIQAPKFPGNPEQLGILMPYFSGADSNFVYKLNQTLFLDRLQMAGPLAYKKKVTHSFSEIPSNSINYEKPSTIDYKVEFINDRLVVIRWYNEGCGAYCSNWADFSYVDLKNLRIVPTSELVKETKLGELSLQLYNVALKKYQAQINLEKKYLRNKKIDAESRERSEETISGYESCKMNTQAYFKKPPRTFEGFYHRIELLPQGLSVFKEECFPHVIRALDEVGEVKLSLGKEKSRLYLTPLALDLFGMNQAQADSLMDQNTVNSPLQTKSFFLLNQLHSGRIAEKYPIQFYLKLLPYFEKNQINVQGSYFYSKTHKAIQLEGQIFKDSSLELETLDTIPSLIEYFVLKKDKLGRWQGTWKQGNSKVQTLKLN